MLALHNAKNVPKIHRGPEHPRHFVVYFCSSKKQYFHAGCSSAQKALCLPYRMQKMAPKSVGGQNILGILSCIFAHKKHYFHAGFSPAQKTLFLPYRMPKMDPKPIGGQNIPGILSCIFAHQKNYIFMRDLRLPKKHYVCPTGCQK